MADRLSPQYNVPAPSSLPAGGVDRLAGYTPPSPPPPTAWEAVKASPGGRMLNPNSGPTFPSAPADSTVTSAIKAGLNVPHSLLSFGYKALTQPFQQLVEQAPGAYQAAKDLITHPSETADAFKLAGQNALAHPIDAATLLAKNTVKDIAPPVVKQVLKGDFKGARETVVNDPSQVAQTILLGKGAVEGIDALTGKPIIDPVTGMPTGERTGTNLSGAVDKGVNKINDGLSTVAEKGGKLASDVVKPVVDSTKGALDNVKTKVAGKLQDRFYQQALEDWQKPTESPKAAFRKANDVYQSAVDRGTDIPKTLVDNKIRLSDNVTNVNGNNIYDTADTAERIRSDAGKLSGDLLRPSLKIADQGGAPRTPVQTVIERAVSNIQNDVIRNAEGKPLPIESKNAIIAKIRALEPDLAGQYRGGMTLENLLDEKIVRDGNAKYSPVGDIGTNAEAIKNKALADSARQLLDATTPPEIPIRAFQDEISKQYQAANYLDQLQGKTVPKSRLQTIARFVAKGAGAAVGEVAGGGVFAGVAGYHIGGMVESFFENIPAQLKGPFLDNLRVTNPEAFSQLQQYIGTEETARLTRKALPSPTELGTPQNPIIPAAPTSFEPQSPNNNYAPDTRAVPVPIVSGEDLNTPPAGASVPIERPLDLRPKPADNTLNLRRTNSTEPAPQSPAVKVPVSQAPKEPTPKEKTYYHATESSNVPQIKKSGFAGTVGDRSKGLTQGNGVWLSSDKSMASDFGKFTLEKPAVVETTVKGNIYKLPAKIESDIHQLAGDKKFIAELKAKGYVGFEGVELGGKNSTFVFDANAVKVKSKTGLPKGKK